MKLFSEFISNIKKRPVKKLFLYRKSTGKELIVK